MGQLVSFDYLAAESMARALRLKWKRPLVESLRALETGAIYALRGKQISELLDG